MPITIKIPDFDNFEKKLRGSWLVEPELDAALDTISTRLLRPGKGRGERSNTMTLERGDHSRSFKYSRRGIRHTGSAKRSKMIGIYRGMTGRVFRKMFERIATRWAS